MPLLEIAESTSTQTVIKSARMHLCHYLLIVAEVVEAYIEEEVSKGLATKIFTDLGAGSTTTKAKSA